MTLLELQSFCTRIREEASKIKEKLYIEKVASISAEIIDHISLDKKIIFPGLDLTPYSSVISASKGIIYEENLKIEQTKRRNPSYDWSFEVCCIPTKECLLALLYTEQNEFTQLWISQPEVKLYLYYDSSDKPDEISEKEWEKRKNLWNKALKNNYIPSLNGFSINFVDSYIPYSIDAEKIISSMPSLEQRIANCTKYILLDQYIKDNKIKSDDIFKTYLDAQDWVNSDKSKQQRQNIEIILQSKLIDKIKNKDLQKPIPKHLLSLTQSISA